MMSAVDDRRRRRRAASLSLLSALLLAYGVIFSSDGDDEFGSTFVRRSLREREQFPLLGLGDSTFLARYLQEEEEEEEVPVGHFEDTAHHASQTLCYARVDDGTVITESVLAEGDDVRLALPADHGPTPYTLTCTTTDPSTGEVTIASTREGTVDPAPPNPEVCDDPHAFRPGYYLTEKSRWVDHCTGKESDTAAGSSLRPMSAEHCPGVHAKKDVWVHIVGDSVTRMIPQQALKWRGATMHPVTSFYIGRNSKTGRPDLMLGVHRPKGSEGVNVWFSYTFDTIGPNDPYGETWFGLPPLTWGEFVDLRGEGPKDDGTDPLYDRNRVPDLLMFSPGYHATTLTSMEYQNVTDTVLGAFEDHLGSDRMPPTYLLLNMMPAYWKIPERYASDRAHRTMLNEYRKDLGLIEASRGRDFVKGVVDFFSAELPFNGGPEGGGQHSDAVHLGGGSAARIVTDRLVHAVCAHEFDAGSPPATESTFLGASTAPETPSTRSQTASPPSLALMPSPRQALAGLLLSLFCWNLAP